MVALSEKHINFEKIVLMVLTNQLIYLVNVKTKRKIFSNSVCFSERPNSKHFREFNTMVYKYCIRILFVKLLIIFVLLELQVTILAHKT